MFFKKIINLILKMPNICLKCIIVIRNKHNNLYLSHNHQGFTTGAGTGTLWAIGGLFVCTFFLGSIPLIGFFRSSYYWLVTLFFFYYSKRLSFYFFFMYLCMLNISRIFCLSLSNNSVFYSVTIIFSGMFMPARTYVNF